MYACAGNTMFGGGGASETGTYTGDKEIDGDFTAGGVFSVADSSGVIVGSTSGQAMYIDGDGDLYVRGELEVQLQAYFKNVAIIDGGRGGQLSLPSASNSTLDATTFGGEGRIWYTTTDKTVVVSTNTTTGGYDFLAKRSELPEQFTVSISTPYSLGTVYTIIAPDRDYAYTISSMTAHVVGGTSVKFMVEQRSIAGIDNIGTDVLVTSITATTSGWIGDSFNDNTVPANTFLVLQADEWVGDVDRLFIKYNITR